MTNLLNLFKQDFATFKKILSKEKDISKENYYSLLKNAVFENKKEMVDFLLKKVDINFDKKNSVLLDSILTNNKTMTAYLLKKGAEVGKEVFSASNSLETIKEFMFYNKLDKKNPIYIRIATFFDNKEKVDFLLKEKFCFNEDSIDNSIINNNQEIFKSLIENSSENISPSSFLKLEIKKHKMLLDLLFYQDKIDGKKMIQHSVLKEDKDMLKYLIQEKKIEPPKSLLDNLDNFDLKEFLLSLISSKDENKVVLPQKKDKKR